MFLKFLRTQATLHHGEKRDDLHSEETIVTLRVVAYGYDNMRLLGVSADEELVWCAEVCNFNQHSTHVIIQNVVVFPVYGQCKQPKDRLASDILCNAPHGHGQQSTRNRFEAHPRCCHKSPEKVPLYTLGLVQFSSRVSLTIVNRITM